MKENAPYKDFGERLRSCREEEKLTRKELSYKIGISDRTIDNYEWGIRMPAGDICAKLAIELNTTTDYLLGVKTLRS